MDHSGALLRLFTTAAAHHGVVQIAQATAAGLHPMQVHRLAKSEGWKRQLPGVYADPRESGFEQELFAAWLWAGRDAVVSHRSAAKLLGLDGIDPNLPEVTVPPQQHPRSPSVIVHRTELPKADRRLWNRLPVTSAARTIIDLAAVVDVESLAMAVDCAWRRHLVSLEWLERRMREIGAQGRAGTRELSRVLRDCRARGQPLDSALEVKLWFQWPRSLPRPVPGWIFEHGFGQPGRIDFAFPDQRLAIECDGFQVHSERRCFERDCVRLSRLAALGWRVLHVTWKQLQNPEEVFQRIAASLQSLKYTDQRLPRLAA
jgi:hypothetical protein